MAKQIDKNEQFYQNYLTEPDSDMQAVTTGLGIATFRVLNQELIDGIKKSTWADEVEGEFSFIRNKHLHYKPYTDSGAVSAGVLTFRAGKTNGQSIIQQFAVMHNDENDIVHISSFDNDGIELSAGIFDPSDLTIPALSSLANIIAEAFNAW